MPTPSGTDTEDEYKRKREELDEHFGRNKLTKRTPPKHGKDKKENTEDKMIAMMKELMNKNEEMMDEIKQIRKEQMDNRKQIDEIKRENEEMKEDIKTLNWRLEKREKEEKRKQLRITGVKIDTNDDKAIKQTMEGFIEKELRIKIKVKNARKIGDKACIIETESLSEKIDVLKNKNKLRELEDRIYIEAELTEKELEIQREIRKIAKEEKQKGKQTKIGYKKLIINGITLKWDEKEDKLKKWAPSENPKNY